MNILIKLKPSTIISVPFFTTESHDDHPSLENVPFPSILPINISVNGVQQLLRNLNVHKSTGPDCIPERLLKELSMELKPALTQTSLQQSRIPTSKRSPYFQLQFAK